jgi:hypothetical protein
MTEDIELYLCWRVEDMPNPRPEAIIGRCDSCGCKIYMMPGAPTRMPKVCHPCGAAQMAAAIATMDIDDTITFMPGAVAREKPH